MIKNEQSSPRPLLTTDGKAGTEIEYYAVTDDGFFGSLAHREAAQRPANESAIRGTI